MLKADRDAQAATDPSHVLVGRLTVEAGGDSAHSRRSNSGSLAMLAAMRRPHRGLDPSMDFYAEMA